MSKDQIIAAIEALAHDGMLSAAARQSALEDIEFAAQEQREALEERCDD